MPRQPAAVSGLQPQDDHLVALPPHGDLPAQAPPLPEGRYGAEVLKAPHCTPLLAQHLASFQQLQRGPAVSAKPSPPATTDSLEHTLGVLHCFLGYVALALRVPLGGGLAVCLQPRLVGLFLRAKVQAGHSREGCKQVTGCMSKVALWWGTQALSQLDQQHMPALRTWLSDQSRFIGMNVPRKRKAIEDLQRDNAWCSPSELMQAVELARTSTVALLSAAVRARRLTSSLAREVHDTLLAVLLWGYIPPVRVSCIVELTFDGLGCADPDCGRAGCLGNRVQRDAASGTYSMHLPHHKTQRHTRTAIVFPRLPDQVGQLLHGYLTHCRPLLARPQAGARSCFLTVWGRPMTTSGFSGYWQTHVLAAIGLGHLHFPPVYLRHMFVTSQLEGSRGLAGARHADAAVAMGNSVRHWEETYFLSSDSTRVQRAVEDMPAWRRALLRAPGDSQ